ncbi:hypothetical protein H6768_03505 [Candidatus Peribacteria bacterium]|nr:hypothetical protein [Candidatus Peribacteria bacterium]
MSVAEKTFNDTMERIQNELGTDIGATESANERNKALHRDIIDIAS